ncbi:MAG: ABC transporter substrate-binding protein [Streptosporangiaceae bacterium]
MRLLRLRTWPVTAAAVTMVLAGAAACGGTGGGAGGGNGQGGGGKTLTYWASVEGTGVPQTKQTLGPVIKKFEKKTGITVDYHIISWENLLKKILTAETSGTGPDVVDIGNTWSPSLAATDAFVTFDQATMRKVGGSDRFVQRALKATGLPGKSPMSLPIYGEAYALFYNKKAFKEAGIGSPPATWDEFVADARKLTDPPKKWGAVIEGSSYTEGSHWAFMLGQQYGNPLYKNGKPNFATPTMVKAVRQYVDLIGSDKVVNPAAAQYESSQFSNAFASGKSAMLIAQNITMGSLIKLGMKPSEFGVAPMPLPDPMPAGGKPVQSHTAGINLAVFKYSQNKDAAYKFVRYMTSESAQVALNKGYGTLPTVASAYDASAFGGHTYQVFKNVYAHHSQPMPLVPSESQMETSLGGAVVDLVGKAATSGQVSDQQVMSALKSAEQKVAAAGAGG